MSIVHCEVGQYKRSITAIALDDEDKYAYCGTKSGDIMCVHTKSAKFKRLFKHKVFGKCGVQSIEFIEDNGEKWLLAGCGRWSSWVTSSFTTPPRWSLTESYSSREV